MSNKKFKAIWFTALTLMLVILITANVLATQVFYTGLTVFFDGTERFEDNYYNAKGEKVDFAEERSRILEQVQEELGVDLDELEDMDMEVFTTHYPSDFAAKEEAFANGHSVAQRIVGEGSILLKNEGSALPLAAGSKVSVFGNTARHVVYGGTGSGDLGDTGYRNINEVLRDIAGYEVNQALEDWYKEARARRGVINMYAASTFNIGEESVYNMPRNPQEAFDYENYSDAAVIVYGRPGGEGEDLLLDMTQRKALGRRGEHQLMLDEDELDLLEHVKEHFDKIIVIINSSQPLELGVLADDGDVDAILWMGVTGQGIDALGHVLNGTINPSGKTPDIYARHFLDDPTIVNFGHFPYDTSLDGSGNPYHYVDYAEGIYIGYRYYETRFIEDGEYWENVVFPMGYGLSYTGFEWELVSSSHEQGMPLGEDDMVSFTVRVINTGNAAGRDVVQLYYSAPYTAGGIEKSEIVLGAFAKTGTIEPGQYEEVTLEMPVRRMASYDWNDANGNGYRGWELESGEYSVTIRTDSRRMSAIPECIFTVENNIQYVYDEVTGTEIIPLFDNTSYEIPVYLSRNDWEGTWPAKRGNTASEEVVSAVMSWEDILANDANDAMPVTGASNGLELRHFLGGTYDDPRWDDLLDMMTVSEMRTIIETAGYRTAPAASIAKPVTVDVDGPSTLNEPMSFVDVVGGSGLATDFSGKTAYPAATLLAATWDVDLAYSMGNAMGNEALNVVPTVSGWYAPGMNTHRNPFGGRVFEYYSEDPVLGGLIGASVVKGVQDKGVTAYVKHFAVNEQEQNRSNRLLTWANEQSMRELYFRQFELAVKVGGARGMMSAFNYIGPIWAGGNRALLTNLLRDEWGFRGTAITDFALSTTGGGFMKPDQAIRAGNDIILEPWGANTLKDAASATAVGFMRQAAKNVLWTTLNSNAMNSYVNPNIIFEDDVMNLVNERVNALRHERIQVTPTWVSTLVIVDIICGILLASGVVFVIIRLRKQKTA